jgi:transposase
VPASTVGLGQGLTLNVRARGILKLLDRPRMSDSPTEGIDGRLKHLRGVALGFRNIANYIALLRLEACGFRLRLPPQFGRADKS